MNVTVQSSGLLGDARRESAGEMRACNLEEGCFQTSARGQPEPRPTREAGQKPERDGMSSRKEPAEHIAGDTRPQESREGRPAQGHAPGGRSSPMPSEHPPLPRLDQLFTWPGAPGRTLASAHPRPDPRPLQLGPDAFLLPAAVLGAAEDRCAQLKHVREGAEKRVFLSE